MKRKLVVIILLLVNILLVSSCGNSKHICSVEGCNVEVYKDDLCADHYVEESIAEATSMITPDPELQGTLDDNTDDRNLENSLNMGEENILEIKKEETIYMEDLEFTLNKVEFSYDVVPENPPSFYSHYPADPGQVYIHVDADVKNLQKSDLYCDEIYAVIADRVALL